ncbi:hypothetical protein GF354_01955 [Candidatus Peregrinibacteria bacterium]|nr:hypothetical protein [Candidatus Peregrinibacteria bacterium]
MGIQKKLSQPFDQEIAEIGFKPNLITNKNLSKLLKTTFGLNLSDIFITNLFPYIKPGNMNSNIPQKNFDKAFKEFCLPQIDIITPSLVICCGKKVYSSANKHLNNSSNNQNQSFIYNSTLFYFQYHPSPLSVNRNVGIKQAQKAWAKMKKDWE